MTLSNCPTGPLLPTVMENIVVKIINGIIDGKKKITLKYPLPSIFLKIKYEKNKDIGNVTKQETIKKAKDDRSIER